MTPDTVFELKRYIMEAADMAVAALERRQAPKLDGLTTRQAYERFGRRWVARQVKLGRIRGRRRGEYKQSPIIFSLSELLALKEAEGLTLCVPVQRKTKAKQS